MSAQSVRLCAAALPFARKLCRRDTNVTLEFPLTLKTQRIQGRFVSGPELAAVSLVLGLWWEKFGVDRSHCRGSGRFGVLLMSGAGLFVACSASLSAESGSDYAGGDGDGDGDAGGDGDVPDPDAPEMELEESFRAPVVSGKYLFSVNPESNKVARINAETLDIDVLEAGNGPTYLATIPPGATAGGALVINVRSQDVSLFLSEGAPAQGDDLRADTPRINVQAGASAATIGASGRFAVVWSNALDGPQDFADGYQDLTVIDLGGATPQAERLSVGFRPSKVFINALETHAYVVSGPGISVIDLQNGPFVLREIALPEDDGTGGRDVSFSSDGALAFVRRSGSPDVLLVATATGEESLVSLPGPVTDLDLSADGKTAVAVVRGGQTSLSGQGGQGGQGGEDAQSTIALLDTDTIFEHPGKFTSIFTEEVVGSAVVSPDANEILLFTNAQPNSRLSILRGKKQQNLRVVDLKAPVLAAFLTEDGADSVVLMLPPVGSTKAGAFALLPVTRTLPARIEGTSTVPRFVSLSGAAGRALITTEATGATEAVTYFGRLTEQSIDPVTLRSVPLSSGIVDSAGQGFVSQSHPEGRVTFLDLPSGAHKTVTGFELASKVVE